MMSLLGLARPTRIPGRPRPRRGELLRPGSHGWSGTVRVLQHSSFIFMSRRWAAAVPASEKPAAPGPAVIIFSVTMISSFFFEKAAVFSSPFGHAGLDTRKVCAARRPGYRTGQFGGGKAGYCLLIDLPPLFLLFFASTIWKDLLSLQDRRRCMLWAHSITCRGPHFLPAGRVSVSVWYFAVFNSADEIGSRHGDRLKFAGISWFPFVSLYAVLNLDSVFILESIWFFLVLNSTNVVSKK
jgi:hypothetical protein